MDFSVQLQFLDDRLNAMPAGEKERLCAASLGGLMATLFQKKEEARLEFHKTFRSFDNDDTAQQFHTLLLCASSK